VSTNLDWVFTASPTPSTSPPPPPHIAAGPPRDTVGHHPLSTVAEHRRFPTAEPPLHRHSLSMSPNTSKVARRVALPRWCSHRRPCRPSISSETALGAPSRVLCRAGQHGPRRPIPPLGRASSAWPWVEAGPALCCDDFPFFFFYDSRNSYKLLKYVENIIRLNKYEINFYRILVSRSWY
jgi:hypothetical protein